MKDTLKKNRFYVYALLDPRKPGQYQYGKYRFDYEPFYIGKGCGSRMWQHTAKCTIKSNKNPHLYRKIKKIQELNLQPVKIKIEQSLEESDALLLEKMLVELIGRCALGGVLTNIDEGGNSTPQMTEEMKARISKTKIEYYKNHIHYWIGKKHSSETKEKISKNHSDVWTGKRHTAEEKNKVSMANKGRRLSNICNEYIFISPDNLEVVVKNGIKYFCNQYNLYLPSVRRLISGKRKTTKGWKFKEQTAIHNSGKPQVYKVTSPQGVVYVVNHGLKTFCIGHNLYSANLIQVAQGKRKHHKHWKCEYLK